MDHGDVSAAASQRVGEFLGHGSVAFVPAMHIDVDRRAAESGQGERVLAYVADELASSGGGQHVSADSRVKAGVRDPFLGDHLRSGSSSPQGIRRADGRSPHHAANPASTDGSRAGVEVAPLALHTERAGPPGRPRHLALLCVSPAPQGRATVLIGGHSVHQRLLDYRLAALPEPYRNVHFGTEPALARTTPGFTRIGNRM
ncbi:hypothetical protein ABZ726_18425 [Streptomyces hundungensis]|uniref:hypothetical protein n=1 Tax=Streptomyces hundungensis TaxID=1077946 RepID=UPI003400CE2D